METQESLKDKISATLLHNETAMRKMKNAKKIIYNRGVKNTVQFKGIADRKIKGRMKQREKKFQAVIEHAVQSEVLLTEDPGFIEVSGMENTRNLSQKKIYECVDLNTKRTAFDLKLEEFGPYALDYTRNGKFMLIGGRKGHVATFDWRSKKLGCELHLKETVRDVQWLHNETMFAVAQKRETYIYDNTGMEIHCLKSHIETTRLTFLPYHFILASVGKSGSLRYQDVSTGAVVANFKTKLGPCDTMAQNPYNAIINLGHSNGTVTLWSPSTSSPLVKMLCHRSPVKSIAIDQGGYYMATTDLDNLLKIWDLRTYKNLHAYKTYAPATDLAISQLGLLAVSYGSHVEIWKDALSTRANGPYLRHKIEGSRSSSIEFSPFNDVLGVGHCKGITSMIVPGSGEPNYDALEVNPYATKKMRKRSEVVALLDKLQPEMIAINPNFVATIDRASSKVISEEKKLEWEANNPNEKFTPRNRARGKSSALNKLKRKNVVVQEKNISKPDETEPVVAEKPTVSKFSPLDRFAPKKK